MKKSHIQDLLDKWGVAHDAAFVLDRWSEPHRHYHGLSHLYTLIDAISQLGGIKHDLQELLILVALYHDIVYIPGDPENEQKSADLFMSGATDPQDAHRDVTQVIISTKTHNWRSCTTAGARIIAKIFNRLDMSVVESDMPGLLEWERGIRAEFSMYGDEEYRRGRTQFLRSLLDRYPHNRHRLQDLIDHINQ
jgi:predicted metal-dependent HD superfamily phosphohydrolase